MKEKERVQERSSPHISLKKEPFNTWREGEIYKGCQGAFEGVLSLLGDGGRKVFGPQKGWKGKRAIAYYRTRKVNTEEGS